MPKLLISSGRSEDDHFQAYKRAPYFSFFLVLLYSNSQDTKVDSEHNRGKRIGNDVQLRDERKHGVIAKGVE